MAQETEIAASDSIFRCLVEQTLAGIYVIQDGYFRYVNPVFAEMFGYASSADIVDRIPVLDLVAPADRQRVADNLRRRIDGERKNIQYSFVGLRRDGTPIDIEVNGGLLEYQDKPAVIGLALVITERKCAEMVLAEENQKNMLLLRMASDGIHILDLDGNVLQVNDTFCRMLDYSHEEMQHMNVTQWDRRWSAAELKESFAQWSADGVMRVFETRHRRRGGDIIDVEVSAICVNIAGTRMLYASSRDITQRKLAEQEMRLAAMVYQCSSEAMMVTDTAGTIISVNPAFTILTGYAADEAIGKNPRLLKSGRHEPAFYQAMWQALIATGHWQGEIWNRRKNGEIFPESLSINTIFNEDGSAHWHVAMFSDITQKKESEALIWQQANFDSLTGLPNRRMLHDRLEQDMRKARRSGLALALMFLDLDHFKEVNDTLGHAMGDILLQEAAWRLSRCVRESDTVARLGGDEFIIILDELLDPDSVQRIAHDILQQLAAPFALGDEIAHVSASIGITLYPADAEDAETLFKSADQAMYAAKHRGRNRFSFFVPAMREAHGRKR